MRIEVATHANLGRMLRNGELDLLVVGESYREKGLVSRTIVEDVIVPVAARSHAICKVQKPTMRHLSQHPWILQPDNVLHRQWGCAVVSRIASLPVNSKGRQSADLDGE